MLRLEHVSHLVHEQEHDKTDSEPPPAEPDVKGGRHEHREEELGLEQDGAELDEKCRDRRDRRPKLPEQPAPVDAAAGLDRLVVAPLLWVLLHLSHCAYLRRRLGGAASEAPRAWLAEPFRRRLGGAALEAPRAWLAEPFRRRLGGAASEAPRAWLAEPFQPASGLQVRCEGKVRSSLIGCASSDQEPRGVSVWLREN